MRPIAGVELEKVLMWSPRVRGFSSILWYFSIVVAAFFMRTGFSFLDVGLSVTSLDPAGRPELGQNNPPYQMKVLSLLPPDTPVALSSPGHFCLELLLPELKSTLKMSLL